MGIPCETGKATAAGPEDHGMQTVRGLAMAGKADSRMPLDLSCKVGTVPAAGCVDAIQAAVGGTAVAHAVG